MCVNAGEDWRCEDSPVDVARVVAELLEELNSSPAPGFRVQIAELSFAGERPIGSGIDTSNHLVVSLNGETGFGALTWHVTESWPRADGIYGEAWVTDNPFPAEVDPRVLSDRDTGTFFHRTSAIPEDGVRAALSEFCSTGTGDRPECVSWVPSRIDGWRLDAAPQA